MQSLLELLNLEPVRFECHQVRRLVLLVVAREVLLQPRQHVVGVVVVQHALVQVRAVAALVALDVVGVQRHFPDAGELARRARAALALVRNLVVERVRPDGERLRFDGDGAVVDVAEVLDDLLTTIRYSET